MKFYIFRTVRRAIYMWEWPTRYTVYFLCLFQLHYPLNFSKKQVYHQEVTSVHAAYSIFHAEIMLKIMLIVYIYSAIKSINIFMYRNARFSKMLH